MSYLTDQLNFTDIHRVIQRFYLKARKHPTIGHFFDLIPDFSQHETKIAAFWWTALGGHIKDLPMKAPQIDMINKHRVLGIQATDLNIWLSLFEQTLFEELDEELAGIWQLRANEIASHLKKLVIDGESMGIKNKEPNKE